MIGTSLGLAVRVTASRAGRGRFAAYLVVGMVAGACLLIVAMTLQVKSREHARFAAAADQVRTSVGGPTSPGMYANLTRYRGRTVKLTLVPDDLDPTHLPVGLGAPPAPGEVRLSPALGDRVEHDPLLAAWFPQERGPDLPVAAVGTAGEYTALIGVDGESAPYTRGAVGQVIQKTSTVEYYQWLGLLLFVAVPGAGLVALSSRFGRRARRERLAALRLLGMPALACRTSLAVETAVPITLGALASVVVAASLRPHHVVLPVVARWVFGEDAALSVGVLAVIVGVTGVLGAWIGAATPLQRETGRLRAAVARADLARPWTAGVYLLGAVLVVVAALRTEPKDPVRFAGIVLVACGLPGAVALGARLLARLLPWSAGPVPWFLAMRKLAADPRSLTRVAGLVAVIVFVVGVSQPIAQLVASPGDSWVGAAEADGRRTVVGWSESAEEGRVPLELVGPRPPGTQVAIETMTLWHPGGDPAGRALVASCADLESLFDQPLPGCDGRIQRLVGPGTGLGSPLGELESRPAAGGASVPIPAATSALEVPEQDLALPDLVIPPELAPEPSQRSVAGVVLRVDTDDDAWVSAQAWIVGASPVFRGFNSYDGTPTGDTTGSWIVLGFGLAAVIAAIGAALTGLDEQGSTGEWTGLRALGMASSALVATRLLIAAVATVAALVLATAPALVVTAGFLRLEGERLSSFAPFVVAALLGGAAISLTSGATAVLQMRRIRRRR